MQVGQSIFIKIEVGGGLAGEDFQGIHAGNQGVISVRDLTDLILSQRDVDRLAVAVLGIGNPRIFERIHKEHLFYISDEEPNRRTRPQSNPPIFKMGMEIIVDDDTHRGFIEYFRPRTPKE